MMATLLVLITIFSFSAIILSLAENINIDCGSTRSYVDSSNVKWVGDEGFVTTGKSVQIPDVVTKPLNTLRYFPTGQTNCYTNIPATKHQKTLVRTKFYYGNYDGKSLPPSFDVVYNGKHRVSIEITVSSVNDEEPSQFSEVIFAPVNENISVCLLRTSPSDNPFISSIEVYGLDKGMYDDLGPDEGLILGERITYGAKETISYPSDPYGRLWEPSWSQDSPELTDLTTSAASIDITRASNRPPEIVMSKALSGEGGLILSQLSLPLTSVPIYLALYFSEPQSLGRTQKRSFNIFLDLTQVGSGIVPALGKASQIVLRDVLATSISQIVFQSTPDSTLPPIINGLELYSISNSREGDNDENVDNNSSEEAKPRANKVVGDGVKANGGKKKKNKLPLILGVTFASVFAVLSSTFGALFMRKRRNAHDQPHSNTAPTMATGHGTGTGMSPLVGQQFASDTNMSPLAGQQFASDTNDSYDDHKDHH